MHLIFTYSEETQKMNIQLKDTTSVPPYLENSKAPYSKIIQCSKGLHVPSLSGRRGSRSTEHNFSHLEHLDEPQAAEYIRFF